MKKSSPLAFFVSLTSGLIQSSFFDSFAEATTTFNRLSKNDSSLQSSNSSISSTPSKVPNFIRPSVNPTAECNLWGLLCQTGLITVGVNMTTTVTTTTVPCSYYLSAQAQSAQPGYSPGRYEFRPEAGYLSSFGRSPECSIYADDRKANPLLDNWDGRIRNSAQIKSEEDALSSAFQVSKCGSLDRQKGPRQFIPPGVSITHLGGPFKDFYCCGACTLKIREIRLWYFPDSSTYSCSKGSANITSQGSLSSNHKQFNKRIESLLNSSTLITDGQTLTSPSFYLEMVGTASMRDSCGQVGSIYTNALVPVPKDGLSTISLNLPIGATFINRDYGREDIASYTKQVRLEDLACPTWGLMSTGTGWNEDAIVTVGSPYFPIIHPPSELMSFDPAWGRCTEIVTAETEGGYLPYEVFDPPRILVPASALAPAPNPVNVITALDPNPTAKTPSKANPVDSRTPELPSITKEPFSSNLGQHPTQDVEHTSAGKSRPTPAANSKGSDPKKSKHQPAQIDPSRVDHDAADPGPTSDPIGGHSQQASPGIGALIFSAFGAPWDPNPSVKNSDGVVIPTPVPIDGSTVSQTEPVNHNMDNLGDNPSVGIEPSMVGTGGDGHFTVAGQVFTTHLSNVLVDGFTIIPNGVGITRSDTVIKLDSGGNLMVGTSTVKLFNSDPTPPPSTYTFNGQVFRGNPSLLVVNDKTLKPDGDGITNSGTALRLNSGGNLVVGASTLKLASLLPTPLPSVYTVNGQLFTGNPSSLAVDGKTMTPGGAPVTISGTLLRLDSGGDLVVGASTLRLASLLPTPLPSVYTVNGQLFTGNPSSLDVDGKALTPGGAPVTVSGTLLRLDSGGDLVVGASTLNLESLLPTPPPSVYTVNGQLFTGNPSSLAVDGKTMTPGGAPVTVSGTLLRLDSGGDLVVDASTLKLASLHPTPLPSVYTINGQLFTGNPSSLAVDGKTMTLGGAAVTISGTPVRLEPSGFLLFGTADIPLATPESSSGGVAPATFLGGQARVQASQKSAVWLGSSIAVIFLWM